MENSPVCCLETSELTTSKAALCFISKTPRVFMLNSYFNSRKTYAYIQPANNVIMSEGPLTRATANDALCFIIKHLDLHT